MPDYIPCMRCIMIIFMFSAFSEKREDISRIKEQLRAKGATVPPDKPEGSHFDSNCITPVSRKRVQLIEIIKIKFSIIDIDLPMLTD